MATAVLEGLALREAKEQARIEEMAEVDESQFMTAYVSPDEEEDTLPEMEGLDTATVAEVAPVAAAAITPVVTPEIEDETESETSSQPQTTAEEPEAEVSEPEATGTTEELEG